MPYYLRHRFIMENLEFYESLMTNIGYLILVKDNMYCGVNWKHVIDTGGSFFDIIPLLVLTGYLAPYRVQYMWNFYGSLCYYTLFLLVKIHERPTFYTDTWETYLDYIDILPVITLVFLFMALYVVKIIYCSFDMALTRGLSWWYNDWCNNVNDFWWAHFYYIIFYIDNETREVVRAREFKYNKCSEFLINKYIEI